MTRVKSSRYFWRVIMGLLLLLSYTLYMEARTLPASDFNSSEIEKIVSIVNYSQDENGIWTKQSTATLNSLPETGEFMVMGKVNKSRQLYLLLTSDIPEVQLTGIVKITLDKSGYQRYKEDEEIPEVLPEEMEALLQWQAEELKYHFEELNAASYQRDSINAKITKENAEYANYRATHEPGMLDLTNYIEVSKQQHSLPDMMCIIEGCDYIHTSPEMFILGFKDSYIIALTTVEGPEGLSYQKAHAFNADARFLYNPLIRKHLLAWFERLNITDPRPIEEIVAEFNKKELDNFKNALKQVAPEKR